MVDAALRRHRVRRPLQCCPPGATATSEGERPRGRQRATRHRRGHGVPAVQPGRRPPAGDDQRESEAASPFECMSPKKKRVPRAGKLRTGGKPGSASPMLDGRPHRVLDEPVQRPVVSQDVFQLTPRLGLNPDRGRDALFSKKWRRRALCRESAIHHRVLTRKPWPAAAASSQVLDSPCFHALALKLQ